jgi:acyl transferase domain-containing protein
LLRFNESNYCDDDPRVRQSPRSTAARRTSAPEDGPLDVAIVGIGCRFPGGVDGPEALWRMLISERGVVDSPPASRWEARYADRQGWAAALASLPGGGYLEDVAGFDAGFFGIAPREAAVMDPQQRLLLETAWEALEHAGVPPEALAGGDAGVFTGVSWYDYGRLALAEPLSVEPWSAIGSALSATANRISYTFDLHGPSLAVDTACSSALVALHHAAHSLRRRECSVALLGAVSVIVDPALTVSFARAGVLAADGRTKAFAADADGYARSEGCGVLVLKRLEDAVADEDRVIAVIAGSAVTQDGRTDGIMAPNGAAQERAMRGALTAARLSPADVDYVEAHATGTAVGDPVEAAAIGAVYGRGRANRDPCLIGSVKTNVGHLEAAAGLAGLVKAALAIQRACIPATLVDGDLNPAIPFEALNLKVVREALAWASRPRPRAAGVSSFGFGGTNAHVVLREAPPTPRSGASARPGAAGPGRGPLPLPVSAATGEALRRRAQRLADWVDELPGEVCLADLGHTLALRRANLPERFVALADRAPDLQALLRRHVSSVPDGRICTGRAPEQPRSLVWVFSGHGSQWDGMARGLYADEPVFAAMVDSLDPVFLAEAGWSLSRRIHDDDLGHAAADIVQPTLYGIQVALAELWRAYGATPSAVIGHSVGELAAAVAAGAMSASDGARLACRRAAAMRPAVGRGAMLLIERPEHEVRPLIERGGELSVAILPSPGAVVVSGSRKAIASLAARCERMGWPVRRVASDVAFHGPDMDGPAVQLLRTAADLPHARPELPAYRTALADPRDQAPFDASYWATNLRSPVRLHAAVSAAVADGHGCFLELSPHPVVTHSILLTLAAMDGDAVAMGSLRRGCREQATLRQSLASLHCAGVTIDWRRWYPTGRLLDLPSVSWTRTRHWLSHAGATDRRDASAQDDDLVFGELTGGAEPGGADAFREQLHRLVAAELGVSLPALATDRPMRDLGVDSVMAVRIRHRLAELTGLELPTTLLWSHPTISGLASFLAGMLFGSERSPEEGERDHVRGSHPLSTADTHRTGWPAAGVAPAGLGGLLDGALTSPQAAPAR